MSTQAEVRKNATETIRIEATIYNDRDLLDVRVWYSDVTGEAKPTRKGLTLRPETWRELLPLIEEALDGQRRGDGPED